jgi:hypothetical protein
MLSNQEVFDRVYDYAKTMKQPARNEQGTCLYRSPNGPCLIGSLIKDEFYSENLEHQHTRTTGVLMALKSSGIEMKDFQILGDLQETHDQIFTFGNNKIFNQDLLNNLKAVATKYKLEIPE